LEETAVRAWVFLMATLLIAGCSSSSPTTPTLDEKNTLAEEHKIAWSRKRKETLERPNRKPDDLPYQVAEFVTAEQQWCVYRTEDKTPPSPDDFPADWWNEIEPFTQFVTRTGLERAKAIAKQEATRNDILASVVLDLYSKEKPSVLLWYHYDQSSFGPYSRAPRADLEKSLNDFLLRLQAAARK